MSLRHNDRIGAKAGKQEGRMGPKALTLTLTLTLILTLALALGPGPWPWP